MTQKLLIALFTAGLVANGIAAEDKELESAKQEYEQAVPHDNEAARVRYVNKLAGILDGFVAEYRKTGTHKDDQYVGALQAELKAHPAPMDSDATKLSAFIVGKWKSPRHDYLFRRDGSYAMLPIEKGTPTGHWRIEGNQYIDTSGADAPKEDRYMIILLNARYFVYCDNDAVFFEAKAAK
jgi:hypothetical protein